MAIEFGKLTVLVFFFLFLFMFVSQPLHPDNKMKVIRIRTMERGRCTPQLERKSFGKFLAKEECAWAILGRDRTVDLESPSEQEREKWIHALEMLVAYRKELKRVATQFHL
jgi:hypothetical protein